MESTAKLFGTNLRRLRDKRGLTQAMLAEKCDLGVTMIQKLEYGQTSASGKTLDIICRVLEVTPVQLYEDRTQASVPTYASAADFLSKFEGLPPVMQRLVLGLVYQDASYGRGIKLSPEVLSALQALVGPLQKAR